MEIKKYFLEPTNLIPNSPYPLLHYRRAIPVTDEMMTIAYDSFAKNGWIVQWVSRYGKTQRSHYHTRAHEAMVVLTGKATIRFGVADTTLDLNESTYGSDYESGAIELHAEPGDIFIIPAGTAHKTFDPSPLEDFKVLTPGGAHGIPAENVKGLLKGIQLSGFTMIGAYPVDSEEWDWAFGGETSNKFEESWHTPKPPVDPVLGKSEAGICGQWK